jgi:hypothetical protein
MTPLLLPPFRGEEKWERRISPSPCKGEGEVGVGTVVQSD